MSDPDLQYGETGEDSHFQQHAQDDADSNTVREIVNSKNDPCRICGGDHFARNCPDASGRGCFNCGEEGHNKSECPQPRKSAGACFNCGEEGHSKSECPQPRKMTGGCFNCGEEGHNKADCTKPRVFKGACRICGQEGHPAASCPEKPPDICRNCKAEGHQSKDCTANRKFDLNQVADKLPQEAWAMMKKAGDERDIGDFREALQIYSKACQEETFATIGKKMRDEQFKIYLIALSKDPEDVISLIDLQGQLDREYVVGFFFNEKPQRGNLRERWPANMEENLERLKNAGLPYDRQVMKCRNCGEMGHSARGCKQEPTSIERKEVKCSNCGEPGHRVRDCKQPRKSRFGCRNCGADGHEARECPEPRSATDVECRRCNEKGHFAKDCPSAPAPRACRNCGSTDHLARDCDQPRNPETMTCRNCDQTGHAARDCPEPKNWSKVKCNRCGEMGHTVRRCPQPEDSEGPQTYGNDGRDASQCGGSRRSEHPEPHEYPRGGYEAHDGGYEDSSAAYGDPSAADDDRMW